MSILGIVRLAELDPLDNHMRELFGMIEKSVHRLDDFIQRIITYYQNTRELFERNQIDFEALLQDIWVNLAHYEGAEKMHLEMDIREGAKAFYTDQFRLRIILGNLLSNAIKYQRKEEKAPRVKCLVRTSEEEVLIQVSDNGIGIPTEHQDRVFDMFFRADAHKSGSGIGLYIVKEAVERLRGSIEVRSSAEQGSEFTMHIPNLKDEND